MTPAIKHILAEAQRTKQAGFKKMEIHVDDVIEIVAALESALSLEKIKFSGKHAGFIDPRELALCRSGQKTHVFMALRRTKRESTELFFTDELPRIPMAQKTE